MSSILLSNPFVTPAPPVQVMGADPQTALAVTPSQRAAGAGNSGNAGSFSGDGSGFGGRDGAHSLIKLANRNTGIDRPFEATPDSIIKAQTSGESANPFGTNLPNVQMPDPLPTSPYLKPA